ncbi:MAG: mandelate racemase/muconate lactonizing enzyme family protein [Casimicrobiaceae bacterium]
MNIDTIEAYVVRVSEKTDWTMIRVAAGDGLVGWGEATLFGYGALLSAFCAHFNRGLRGRGEQDVLAALAIDERTQAGMLSSAVRTAVDQALWDIRGQRIGCAVHALLGGAKRDAIPAYANVNRGTVDRDPEGFAASALAACEAGFDAIKIAPFDGVVPGEIATRAMRTALDLGLERVRAVRQAIGAGRRLMIDCHYRLTPAAAHQVLRELEPVGLYWFECPIPESPDLFPALQEIHQAANANGVLLAGAEDFSGCKGFLPFVHQRIYDVIMPDIKYCGGLLEMLSITAMANAAGIAVSPHNPTGPVAHAASLHACAAMPAVFLLEHQLGESPLFFSLAGPVAPSRDGSFPIPQGPGLGVAIDEALLREHSRATDA